MMNYEAIERSIRDRMCMRNVGKMRAGKYSFEIITTVDPTEEMIQIGDNFEIKLHRKNGGWFAMVYEIATEREFSIQIHK